MVVCILTALVVKDCTYKQLTMQPKHSMSSTSTADIFACSVIRHFVCIMALTYSNILMAREEIILLSDILSMKMVLFWVTTMSSITLESQATMVGTPLKNKTH